MSLFILNHAFGFDSLRSKRNAPIFFLGDDRGILKSGFKLYLMAPMLPLDSPTSVCVHIYNLWTSQVTTRFLPESPSSRQSPNCAWKCRSTRQWRRSSSWAAEEAWKTTDRGSSGSELLARHRRAPGPDRSSPPQSGSVCCGRGKARCPGESPCSAGWGSAAGCWRISPALAVPHDKQTSFQGKPRIFSAFNPQIKKMQIFIIFPLVAC